MFLLFFSANLLSMQFSRYTGGLKWIRTTTQFTMVAARRFSLLLLPCSLGCRLAASRTAGARLGPFTLIRRALAVSPAVLAAFFRATGGLKWIRTTDLTLIRRAL